MEEESIQQQRNAKRNGNNNNEPPVGSTDPSDTLDNDLGSPTSNGGSRQPPRELYLHELRAEKYNGLVRLLKPGCRTIVLFVDGQSRLQLIPAFHKIIWPYRKLVWHFLHIFFLYLPVLRICGKVTYNSDIACWKEWVKNLNCSKPNNCL